MSNCQTSQSSISPQNDWILNRGITFNQQTILTIQQERVPLDLTSLSQPSPAIENYFRYYDLDVPDAEHYFGSINSGGKKIATHVFKPLLSAAEGVAHPRGTVIMVHGYLDHTGAYTKLIHELLVRGYTVCSADLPGHGLSEGKRGCIDDFTEYGELIKNLYELGKNYLPQPLHIIGHSTGCSAIIEYLLSNQTNPFATCTLIAPLIRCTNWSLTNFAVTAFGFFLSSLPADTSQAATNQTYIKFIREQDPLEVRNVTSAWAKAMIKWNKKLKHYQPGLQPIIVLQGTKDNTVAYTYNLPVIQKLFPHHEIHLIQGAGHTLCCETLSFRTNTFQFIFQALEQAERKAFSQER